MMAQQNPKESIETSSDFMTFQIGSSSTELSEESEKVDVQSFLADQNKIKDFISCRKCKQEFDHDAHKPFLLPCLDAICKSCIQEISESQSYKCVKCSHSHTCFQNGQFLLQIDNTREIASEIFRLKIGGSSLVCGMCTNDNMASHRCFDCSVFICEDCLKLHLSLKTLKSHSFMEIKCLLTGKLKDLGLSYAPKRCPVPGHEKEQLRMHCSDPSCRKNVCVLCAISIHKDHYLCDITKVRKEKEARMETCLKSIKLKVEKANTSIAQLSDINRKCLKDWQKLQNEIKTCFFEAKKALEKREKDLCYAVALYSKEKQMCFESEQKRISSFINSCREAEYYGKVSSEVNDHSHFVDINNVILPQLELLDNQLPEIQVTMDTMNFSSQLLDSCFETAVNSLGKLSVSKVYSSKSKVIVTPTVCYVGQQIQFKIQLFSSTGNLIADEDVSVRLKLNGKSVEFLNCAFEALSSSFLGILVPDKPMKISWIVVSNNIEHHTLNGEINVKEMDTSTAEYRKKKKIYKGNRSERTYMYGKTKITNNALPEDSDKKSYENCQNLYQVKRLTFTTMKDLKIKIYAGSITRLDVDCIVNAANESLLHDGEEAAAISEAAGYQFDLESMDYVRKHGSIPVGRCCVTSAGKLPYRCVIHTVGPRWGDYWDKTRCLQDLKESVEDTFREANKMRMKTLAISPISSGIFAVPRGLCVQQYYNAAMSFSRNFPLRYLEEIHFVDKDKSMVCEIQEIFQKLENLP